MHIQPIKNQKYPSQKHRTSTSIKDGFYSKLIHIYNQLTDLFKIIIGSIYLFKVIDVPIFENVSNEYQSNAKHIVESIETILTESWQLKVLKIVSPDYLTLLRPYILLPSDIECWLYREVDIQQPSTEPWYQNAVFIFLSTGETMPIYFYFYLLLFLYINMNNQLHCLLNCVTWLFYNFFINIFLKLIKIP